MNVVSNGLRGMKLVLESYFLSNYITTKLEILHCFGMSKLNPYVGAKRNSLYIELSINPKLGPLSMWATFKYLSIISPNSLRDVRPILRNTSAC